MHGLTGLALLLTGFAVVVLLVVIEWHLNKLREQREQTEPFDVPATWNSTYQYEREFDV